MRSAPDATYGRRPFGHWVADHEDAVLGGIAALTLSTWLLVFATAPQPFGYVYDDYHAGVQWVAHRFSLPQPSSCWVCANPPLFFALGAIPYGGTLWITGSVDLALRSLFAVTLGCCAWILLSCRRMLAFYGVRGLPLAMSMAIVAGLPVMAISAWSPEADLLLAALLCAFLCRLMRCHLRRSVTTRDALVLGVLAGLAMLTKYSGLLALIWAGAVLLALLVERVDQRRVIRAGLIILLVAGALAGWRYALSYIEHGTPFMANGSAAEGFALERKHDYTSRYEFFSFRADEVAALYRADARSGLLDVQPVYSSVWTALHAMTWSDMNFFSNPSRHGSGQPLYRARAIAPWLVQAVLYLGLVPAVLAAIGASRNLFRRSHWPLGFAFLTTMAVYLYWVVGQHEWALKTKYVLFLVLPAAVFLAEGIRATLVARGRWMPAAAFALMAGVLVASEFFVLVFALS